MTPIVRSTPPAGRTPPPAAAAALDLSAYTQEDPFAQTDLPVSLDAEAEN